jgi:hypothetical protein
MSRNNGAAQIIGGTNNTGAAQAGVTGGSNMVYRNSSYDGNSKQYYSDGEEE